MNDSQKTRKQLIEELSQIRQELASTASSKDTPQKNTPEPTESGNIFYKAFISSPDMFIIANSSDGTYLEVNDSFVKNTGYSREELIGHTVEEVNLWVNQEELDKMNRLLSERGKVTDEEFSFRMKSGEIRQWLCSAEIVNMNGTDHMIAVATDITERKRAEEALRHSEENYRNIIELAPDGIMTVDTKGIVTSCNTSFTELTGFTKAEIVGKHFSKLPSINLKDISIYFKLFTSILKRQKIKLTEMPWKHKDGTLRLCEFQTGLIKRGRKITGIQAIMRDITERKRAEEALKESEERYSKLSEATHDAVIIHEEGKVLDANKTAAVMFGYESFELIGKHASEFLIPESLNVVMEKIRTGDENSYEVVCLRKDGTTFDGEVRAKSLQYHGHMVRAATMRDITERKRAEEALRESEERFRTLFETMAQGVVYQDAEGKIISANPAAERILGLTLEQMQGRTSVDPHWKSILEDGSDFPGEQHPAMESLRTGQPVSGVVMGVYHPVEDEYRWIIIDSVPEFRKGEDTPYRVYTTFTDITGRKRTREILRQSEEKFSKAFHSSPDMITLINLESGKYVEVNDSFISTTGYTREELIGHTRDEINIWASQESEDKMGRLMAESGKIIDEEFHIRTKSGEIRTWQCSADIIDIGGAQCLLGVAADITERIRAEEALRESAAQLKGILRAAPIGIALIQDDIALWVNDYMSILTGYSAKELVRLNAKKLCTSDEEFVRVGKLKVQNIKKYGKSEIESKLVCKNGKIIYLLIISTPLDPEDLSAGEIATMMDITERKKAIEQEREAKNLRELDKLRTELLANVSHELRTPLASIKGFTTVLTDYDKKLTPGEKREYLDIIDHNTDRLSELIEQLLVMSRLGAGMLTIDRSPSYIDTLCQEVISEAKIRSPEYQFVLNLPAKLPRVHIDAKRIRQVLDNLIDNAVKHSSAGTEITLAARKSNGEIVVTVIDEGTGISRKDKPHIFDRMFHAERTHKPGVTGSGLGLSICKGLIEAHKGRIWIESEEGKGTRCFFTLPTDNNRGIRHGKKSKG